MTESKPADCHTYCTYTDTESHTSLCYCVRMLDFSASLPHWCQIPPKKQQFGNEFKCTCWGYLRLFTYIYLKQRVFHRELVISNNNQRFLYLLLLLFSSFPPLFLTVHEGVLASTAIILRKTHSHYSSHKQREAV